MAITSITLNGLQIGVSVHYACGENMIEAMKSGTPREPVMVDRPGTYPAFIRSQVQPKNIPGEIILLDASLSVRRTWYGTLLTAMGNGALVPLVWTEDAVTRTYSVHCGQPVPTDFVHRVTFAMVAPNPVPA